VLQLALGWKYLSVTSQNFPGLSSGNIPRNTAYEWLAGSLCHPHHTID